MSKRKDAAPGAAKAKDTEGEAPESPEGGNEAAEAPETEAPETEAPKESSPWAGELEAGEAAETAVEPVEGIDFGPEEAGAEPEPEPGAEAEVAELKDRLLRAMAETENVRRRAERDRADTAMYGIANFARDVLTVADNLRRAVSTVPEEARNDDEALASLLEGVEITERELLAAFERHGIRPIDPMGEKFDHNWHQAVMQLDEPSSPPGTVVQVMQIGYAIRDRLLRPAMVAVAKGNKSGDDEGQSVDTTV
jgi:molecular chaperone GrpE